MRLAFLVLSALVACGDAAPTPAPEPAAEPAASPAPPAAAAVTPPAQGSSEGPDGVAIAEADAAVQALKGALKAKLMGAMADGPRAAVEVCANEAGAVRDEVAAAAGVQVGRATLRPRNTGNAGPAWVAAWLAERGERKAAGVGDLSEVVDVDGGRVARRIVPIAIDPPCLVCHGPAESLTPDVRTLLAERYPDDKATGYELGDLRGAFWAEAPVVTASN